MNLAFANSTVRSAHDLYADLAACRQLRHLTDLQRRTIVDDSFAAAAAGSKRIYVWTADAFGLAMRRYGYSCDTCGECVAVPDDRARKAGDRALDNLDGFLKLMLCQKCSNKCSAFSRREFDREMRVAYSPDLEKIMLAFIASEIIRLESRLRRGEVPANGK